MFKQIRTSKFTKVFTCYLAIMILLELVQPFQMFALTEGPSQPEFNSFTPIGTSDMVDLTSGDFNYNIPIMDVGGYPINLAYNSGVTMDQEATWVGTGWNLNVGQINRNVRGLPDDFKGDYVKVENNLKTNVTVGVNPYLNAQIIGALDGPALMFGAGLDVRYNNYTGMSAVPSFGPTFKFSDHVSVGMQLSSSVDEGASITPSVSISTTKMNKDAQGSKFNGGLSSSITYNSRQGLQSFNLSASVGYQKQFCDGEKLQRASASKSGSGSISFLNNTFTPVKRLAFKNDNYRFSFSGGPDVWGIHAELSIAGYGSVQKLIDKVENQKAYGYENTDLGDLNALLDFNRENEQGVVSKNTLVLPVTNYTYDIYSVQGQNVGGSFRPFRGQVGYVYDGLVTDQSASTSVGVEIEGGAGVHKGLNLRRSTTTSHTGNWSTVVTPYLAEKVTGNDKNYEKVYYKAVGEMRADTEHNNLLASMGSGYPIALKIDENKNAVNAYRVKSLNGTESSLTAGTSFSPQLKRVNREKRNQLIQKVTKGEAMLYGLTSLINYNTDFDPSNVLGLNTSGPIVPNHHTAGYIITDENGNRNVYGETLYNKLKKEVTFNVGNSANTISYKDGLVRYSGQDNSSSNNKGRDHYFNSTTTPPYAHTYLLTSILSSDYQDLTGNGPSDDDLGNYTKFNYKKMTDYRWRVPFGKMKVGTTSVSEKAASYNEGLKTDQLDQKGSYLYGIKESKYLKSIVTKTHVAIFKLVERRDGFGVKGENGGNVNFDSDKMYRIESISLYSKADGLKMLDANPSNDAGVLPIKTAHFSYDYSLCPGIENNSRQPEMIDGTDINLAKGKLTLRKVYFTYKKSNMGKYTPYVFNYDNLNPSYNVKAYDIWGNYKEFKADVNNESWKITSTKTTPQEFPYVEQDSKTLQDSYASAWSLSSIKMPSGGLINVAYETDDYQFVQDKKAMQMFKIDGVCGDLYNSYVPGAASNTTLYNGTSDAKYAVVKLPSDVTGTDEQIRRKYTEGLKGAPIYFNFLMNMTSSDYEFVTGYFEMDGDAQIRTISTNKYLFIPMKKINLDGNSGLSGNSNPITVAGCFFGRQNLNLQINGLPDPGGDFNFNIVSLGKSLWKNLDQLSAIYKGENGRLKGKGCAKTFKAPKSWIRLLAPNGAKMGGGCRVKSVVLKDQWDKMLDIPANSTEYDRYAKQYGQEYTYKTEDGLSSGVATYEPNICKENPFVVPFYHKPEKLIAQTYQEKPFGESFFPTPTVTYSRVVVRNIPASSLTTKTGEVVTHHYTSKDFPTITDFTNLDKSKVFQSNENQALQNTLRSLLGLKINVKTDLTMSQGFVIETNDMNGKLKKQEVFNGSKALISSVEYKYSTSATNGKVLENILPTIDETGVIAKKAIASHYDVVNDLRESYSNVNSYGMAINVDMIPLGFIPLIIGWGTPERSEHKQILRTAVTTKVIHKSGILKEKIVYDLGSRISTKNHAWDAKTGQILLTETINEFDDNFYTFNYPAYWNYTSMGMASENADITGRFRRPTSSGIIVENGTTYFKLNGFSPSDIVKYLKPGDEIAMFQPNTRMWISGYSSDNTAVSLIKNDGMPITELKYPSIGFWLSGQGIKYRLDFRVLRSSYRNTQMSSMGSITLMKNPIIAVPATSTTPEIYKSNIEGSFKKTTSFDPKIINASAIEYSDIWTSQCENGLPSATNTSANPYLYNTKGNWKAKKSYAYLTGRITTSNSNTRSSGFFQSFSPFYKLTAGAWSKDILNWTAASEVTMYNPYGVEVENVDAMGRYSSAQYGYQYKMPVAVASNSTYQKMGYDGFEDYSQMNSLAKKRHFGFFLLPQDGHITTEKAHTGKKSIAVEPGKKAVLRKKLADCN